MRSDLGFCSSTKSAQNGEHLPSICPGVDMLIQMLELVATVSTALFAGAALYINVVEHPARMSLDTTSAFNQWAPSYARATWLQGPLAVLGSVCGIAVWLLGEPVGWLIGSLLIGAVIPFTFGVIMRTNHTLLSPGRDVSSNQTRELLVYWGQLHAVRTVLSVAGTILFLWLIIGI